MDIQDTPGNLDRLVDPLVQWAGMGTMIIDHMARSAPHVPPDAPGARETFAGLLRDTLAPLSDRYAAADLGLAATVLADAVATIAEEIILVDLD